MKTAIITGAGSGIGLGTACALHRAGMSIVGVGRNRDKLDELTRVLASSERVHVLSVDVTNDDAPRRIVEAALDRFGSVDFLINNAGVGNPKPLHETDDLMLDHFLGLMLRAPFRLAREAIGHMRPGSGIVNVTSTYAMIGGLRGGAYTAAKGGLSMLTQHIACDYGPLGIRANNVAPGVTMTDMVAHRFDDEKFRRINVETTPYPRLAQVDDIAGSIAFLCSPAAEMINGQTIVVDGGWSTTKYISPRALESEWVER